MLTYRQTYRHTVTEVNRQTHIHTDVYKHVTYIQSDLYTMFRQKNSHFCFTLLESAFH